MEYTELTPTRMLIWKQHQDGLVRGILFWVKHKCKIYNSTKWSFVFFLKQWWMTSYIIIPTSHRYSLLRVSRVHLCLVSIVDLKGNVSKFWLSTSMAKLYYHELKEFDQIFNKKLYILKVYNRIIWYTHQYV